MSGETRPKRVWSATGRQLRNPTGLAGWILARLMAHVNWQPNIHAMDALAVRPTDTVVELGFGPGRSLVHLAKKAKRGKVYGFDHSPDMVHQAKRRYQRLLKKGRLHIQVGTFSSLPLEANTVDKVLLVNVIYFFDTAGRDISETYRVLKPGGRVVIYVTHRKTMANWPFCEPETHRTFDSLDVTKLLVQGGFMVGDIRIKPVRLSLGIEGLIITASKNGEQSRPE